MTTTQTLALLATYPILVGAFLLFVDWLLRRETGTATTRITVVTPRAFDPDAARAELVADDLLVLAAVFPEQRDGRWS